MGGILSHAIERRQKKVLYTRGNNPQCSIFPSVICSCRYKYGYSCVSLIVIHQTLIINVHCSSKSVIFHQSDIFLISSCLSALHLTINPNETKYMLIIENLLGLFLIFLPSTSPQSLYRNTFSPTSTLVSLSLLISPGLFTLSPLHICSKARKLIRFLFSHFSPHSPFDALLKLHKSLIIPTFLTAPLFENNLNLLSTPTHLKGFSILVCACAPTTGRLTIYPSLLSLPNSLTCLPFGPNLNSFSTKFSMATCSSLQTCLYTPLIPSDSPATTTL